jgi:phage FluMu protein Com
LKGIRKKIDTRKCPSRLSKIGQQSYINKKSRNCETGNAVCEIIAEYE